MLTLLTQLETHMDSSVLATFYTVCMTWYLKREPAYMVCCFRSNPGRVSRTLELIREGSLFKSGLGDSQRKKENEHKHCPEQSEFLWCSSNLGVPRNLAGIKTDASKEKQPQGAADLTLRLSASQPAHHTPNSCTQ